MARHHIHFIAKFTALSLCCALLAGCSNKGGGGLFAANDSEGPVQLTGREKTEQNALGDAGLASLRVSVDQADLKKAIHRYRITRSIKSGATKIIGADLNGDGVGEALVYFEGDEWCISIGCELVVFVKGANGFRKMAAIKRVKLPVAVSAQSSEGWRTLFVRTGNASIGEKVVALRFRGNYPLNASTVKESLAALPAGHEVLLGAAGNALTAAQ